MFTHAILADFYVIDNKFFFVRPSKITWNTPHSTDNTIVAVAATGFSTMEPS